MAENLVRKVGDVSQDNLFAHVFPRALTKGVKIESGEGQLPRGTILTTEDGVSYKALDTGSEDKANCILADPVDASEADVVAAAYISGNFNINAVSAKPESEATVNFAVEDALRKYDIILSAMQE